MSTKSKPLGHADLSTLYGQLATLDANPTIQAIRDARKSYGEIADRFAASGNSGEARRIRALGDHLVGASISKSGNVGIVDITALKKEVERQKKQLAKIENRLTALETASKQHSATLYGTTGENPTPGLQSQVNELVRNDGVLAQLANTIGTLNKSVNGTAEQRNQDGTAIPATPGLVATVNTHNVFLYGDPAHPDQPSVETRLTALETTNGKGNLMKAALFAGIALLATWVIFLVGFCIGGVVFSMASTWSAIIGVVFGLTTGLITYGLSVRRTRQH